MTVQQLPHLNAALNGLACVLIVCGFAFIRRRNVPAHRACMLGATAISAAFLVSYLVYHFQVGSVRYTGQGLIRTVYFAVLLSHTVLAAAVPFLVAITLWRALRGAYARHRRIARWTLPVWLYVSATGVVIYLMLYRF